MDPLQQIQDDEYTFPYHYVSSFDRGFTQSYYDAWGINYCATIEFILERLEKTQFNALIDIGCGDGRLVKEIQGKFGNKNIAGIDYSQRAIALAKALNPRGNYQQLDIIQDQHAGQYDIAILMEVFEHIDPAFADKFVEAIPRLLRPGGQLWVTVPHVNKPVEYKHYRHFTSQSLIECFAKHFTVTEVVPFEKGKARKGLIDFLLGNRFFILNINRLRSFLYRYYKKNLFHSPEEKCSRIFVKFIVK